MGRRPYNEKKYWFPRKTMAAKKRKISRLDDHT